MARSPYDPPHSRVADRLGKQLSRGQWLSWFYLSVNGRVARGEFWLLLMLPSVVLGVVLYLLVAQFRNEVLFEILFMVAFLWASLAVQVKRWHDTNLSGWWILVNLVPFVGSLVALVINGFVRGPDGDNRFGKDPLAHTHESKEAL